MLRSDGDEINLTSKYSTVSISCEKDVRSCWAFVLLMSTEHPADLIVLDVCKKRMIRL